MIGTAAYIIACSARNRLRLRLRRLREPRYLIGAVVGAAYIYFSFFARFRAPGSPRRTARGGPAPSDVAALAAAAPALGGLLLMGITALGWLVPFDSGLLAFSQPEVQFLFPAPVSRRWLLAYRLMRSQIGMLFGSIVVAIASPAGAGSSRLRIAVAMWVLMCTWKLYFTAISLARSRLRAGDRRIRRVAQLPLVLLVGGLAIVGVAMWRSLHAAPATGMRDLLGRAEAVAASGVAGIVLWPFMALARPLFAPWPGPYLLALLASLTVLTAAGLWVILSDSAFQDAAEEVAARKDRAKLRAASRYRARTRGLRLAARGRPEMVFAWKAALQTLRLIDRGSAIRMAAAFGTLAVASAVVGRRSGWADAFAAFTLAGAMFSIVLGPQALRIDMRQDLQHLELLKTWPVWPAAIVRGELLWPGTLLTATSWILIALALVFPLAPLGGIDLVLRISVGLAAMIAAPAIIFGQLVIHNGMALIFPGWVPLGSQRARGLDAMGQRIIMLAGTWLLLILMMIPGLVPAAIVWFLLRNAVGPAAAIPAAIIVTSVVLVETLVASELLGPAYDRIDILAVERSE